MALNKSSFNLSCPVSSWILLSFSPSLFNKSFSLLLNSLITFNNLSIYSSNNLILASKFFNSFSSLALSLVCYLSLDLNSASYSCNLIINSSLLIILILNSYNCLIRDYFSLLLRLDCCCNDKLRDFISAYDYFLDLSLSSLSCLLDNLSF